MNAMRLVLYEIKKLASRRFVAVVFLLLFASCAVLAYINSVSRFETTDNTAMLRSVYAEYIKDPDSLRERYENLTAQKAEYERIEREEYRKGNFEYRSPAMPRGTYFENIDDLSVLRDFFSLYDYTQTQYAESMKGLAHSAAREVQFYTERGEAELFMCKYNDNMSMISYHNSQMEMEFVIPYGWDKFFNFSELNVFILAFIMLIAPIVVLGDQSLGAENVILTSRNGRLKTSASKMIALFLFSAFAVTAFTAASLLGVFARVGLSSPSTAIQAFKAFMYCPWFMTVLQAALMALSVRVAVFCGCAALFALFAYATRSYRFGLVLSAAFAGANYAAHGLISANSFSFFKWCNLFTAADSSMYFAKYNIIRSGETLIEQSVIVYILYIALVLICGAVYCVLRANVRRSVSFKKLLPRFKLPSLHCRTVFGYECKKTLIVSHAILILAAAVAVQVFVSDRRTGDWESVNDYAYKNYCMYLQGELTEEKEEYIASERARIMSIIASETEMKRKHDAGEITDAEYGEYVEERYLADMLRPALEKIETQLAYIKQQAQLGVEAHFVYDTGVLRILELPPDLVLLALLILALCGIWADEFTSGMYGIMRSSVNGRRRTYAAKTTFTVAFAAVSFVLLEGVRLLFVFGRTDLTTLSSPAVSLASYSALPQSMDLKTLFILLTAARALGAVFAALSVTLFSRSFKRAVYAASVAVFVWTMPSLLGLSSLICPLSALSPADLTAAAPLNTVIFYAVIAAAIAVWTAIYAKRESFSA